MGREGTTRSAALRCRPHRPRRASIPEQPRKSLIPGAYRGEAAAAPADLVGKTVAGWRVERLIGRGGMGSVYLARRGEAVGVIKTLNPDLVSNPQVARRFQREWQALQRVPRHPALVQVLEVPDSVPPVIVLEFVPGQSLFQLVGAQGPLDPAFAARVVGQVAEGLAVVHEAGLLHRDVNPNNLMVQPEGAAKVIDFGVVKDQHRSTLTLPGRLVGTALYMAPEQFQREAQGAAVDVFGLGGTLYFALAGRPPFVASDLPDLMDCVLSGEFTPVRELAPGVPLELERVLVQMLEPEVRYRYRSMRQVAADLARVLRGEPCSAPAFVAAQGWRAPLLDARRFVLGSSPGCEVQVGHPSVAPRHAQVRRESRGWVLYDLKSPSGTTVSGQAVKGAPRVLRNGETVRLGQATLTFVDPRDEL